MKNKLTFVVTKEESNILLNALEIARRNTTNSPSAAKQYNDLYIKLTEVKYGKGSAVV